MVIRAGTTRRGRARRRTVATTRVGNLVKDRAFVTAGNARAAHNVSPCARNTRRRRRELGQTRRSRVFEHAEPFGNAARNAGARTRQETVSAVWSRLRHAARVRHHAGAAPSRAAGVARAQDLGWATAWDQSSGSGSTSRTWTATQTRRPFAARRRRRTRRRWRAVGGGGAEPVRVSARRTERRTDTNRYGDETRVPLTLGAFTRCSMSRSRALAKTAADPEGTPPASLKRRALCHLCWRWETVSYAAALSVLERLDKAEHVEDVAAALRVCEAPVRSMLRPRGAGSCWRGAHSGTRTMLPGSLRMTRRRRPAGADADAEAGAEPAGAVPPHLRGLTAGDRRPADFGVIEQAARGAQLRPAPGRSAFPRAPGGGDAARRRRPGGAALMRSARISGTRRRGPHEWTLTPPQCRGRRRRAAGGYPRLDEGPTARPTTRRWTTR